MIPRADQKHIVAAGIDHRNLQRFALRQHLPHIPLEEQRQLPRERRRARKGHKMISVRRIRRVFFFKTRDKRMTEVVHIQSANRQPPDTRRALRQFGVLIGGIIIA